jgi:hypothetical protein
MPGNGEINKFLGVYRSVCCDAEIVILEGAIFPDCPNHPHLPTKWRAVSDEPIPHVSQLQKTKKQTEDTAA